MRFDNFKNKQSLDKLSNPVSTSTLDKGDKLLLESQYKEAVVEYLGAVMNHGSSVKAYMGASKAYKGLKEYDKAIRNLERARKLSSFDAEIYYELGINHLLNCNTNRARKNFINTIRLDKKNVNAQIQLAVSHELLGEPEMAFAIYNKIIEENPRLVSPHLHSAALCMTLEMHDEALGHFYKILKINPKNYRANLGIGICLDKLGRHANAVRFYKKYIVKKPKSATTRALVGRICEMYAKKDVLGTKHNLRLIASEC